MKYLRSRLPIALACSVIGVLGAPAATVPAAAADLGEIRQRGSLKVLAWREEEPEMFNFGSGEPGFERELIERFGRLHRLQVEIVPVARFGDVIEMLNRGEGDVISGIIETDARRRLVDFTHEVLPARHVVVSLRPHRVVMSASELQDERVGVVRNTSWHAALSTS